MVKKRKSSGAAGKKAGKRPARKQAARKQAAPKKAVPKKAVAKKAAAKKKAAPKRPAAKKPAAKKAPPKKAAPRKQPAPAPKTLPVPKDPAALAAVWNEAGRAYNADISARLEKFYGGDQNVDLDIQDPRSEAMGDRVIEEVIALNAAGRWQEARERFDPAYAPVFRWIKGNERNTLFPTILGPDELLVRCGSPWLEEGVTYHLHGGTATPIPDIRGVCRSRGRDYLVLARSAGLEVRDARAGVAGFSRPPIASIPWPSMDIFRPRALPASVPWTPDEPPIHVEQLGVSDDGMRIVVSCYRQGILLASRHPGEPAWQLLWPEVRDGDAPRAGDMTHVAISRDGTRLAYGCQDAGHFLAEIGAGGELTPYATAGHLSEYPHYACFSDDGRFTALNSCHFYNGATIGFDWQGTRGKNLPTYEVSDEAPVIDGSLRVYAATWVHKPVLDALLGKPAKSEGAFILAGNGIMRLVNAKGALGAVQGFGSSAGGIDFCPESRRLAISSYSGFVHLYDPYEEELPGRIDGVKPRREVARWALWEQLPNGPVRW